MIDLYANIIAQVSFWIGSIQLRNGTLHRTFPSLLVFSALLFLTREILQVLSVGVDYIGDVYSYIEILSIIFSLVTARTMFHKVSIIGLWECLQFTFLLLTFSSTLS